MLEIDIKLNPYGDNSRTIVIGNIFIANVGGSFGKLYNYVYMIYEPESRFSEEVCLDGLIKDHNPHNPASLLLRKIIQDYGESSCDISKQYRDHWLEGRV